MAIATLIIFLGAGCPQEVQDEVTTIQTETQKNIEHLNQTVEQTKKVSNDFSTLMYDLNVLFGNTPAQEETSTDVPPSADQPQP